MNTDVTVGFIGVGAIASDIVEGLSAAGGGPSVLLSPRGAERARDLAARHERVRVCETNQEVVDGAPVIVLAVRPDDAAGVLGDLTIPRDRVVVSAVAGLSLASLGGLLAEGTEAVRSIPMPPVRERQGVTALFPDHPAAQALFGPLGSTVVAGSEGQFDALSAATATVSTHLSFLGSIAEWLQAQGWDADAAGAFVRGIYGGLGPALADSSRTLPELAASHETPAGLNEQVRTTWFDDANQAALQDTLGQVLARVRGGS